MAATAHLICFACFSGLPIGLLALLPLAPEGEVVPLAPVPVVGLPVPQHEFLHLLHLAGLGLGVGAAVPFRVIGVAAIEAAVNLRAVVAVRHQLVVARIL